jgi:CheY-like chemotaxis protein
MSHVLVIDHNQRVLETAKAMLESAGFTVAVAGNGADALNQFQREKFDLVICDVRMPRKDGLEAIARIRRLAPDLPIVAMASGDTGARAAADLAVENDPLSLARISGATRTIFKPFSRDELLSVMRACIVEKVTKLFD